MVSPRYTNNEFKFNNINSILNRSKSPLKLNLIDATANENNLKHKSPMSTRTLNYSQIDESKINTDQKGSPASKLRNVNLKVSRTSDYENLKNISNISSEMKNKNNFIDELNTWKLNNNYKASTSTSLNKKQIIPKSKTFKNLNDLNIMKTFISKEVVTTQQGEVMPRHTENK